MFSTEFARAVYKKSRTTVIIDGNPANS